MYINNIYRLVRITRRSYEIEILEFVFQVIFHPSYHGMYDKITIWEFGNRKGDLLFQLFSRRKSKNQDPPSIQPKKKRKKHIWPLSSCFVHCIKKILLPNANRYIWSDLRPINGRK